MPTWEEVFYLSPCASGSSRWRALYAAAVRDARPGARQALLRAAGRAARHPGAGGRTVRSDEELREAVERWPHYFGRGVYSRGGVTLLTNTGPLAGRVRLGGRPPDPRRALARAGVRGRADGLHLQHAARRPRHGPLHLPRAAPVPPQHRRSSSSRSPASESLEVVERLGAALDYTGQMSLDFVDSERRAADHRVQPAHHRRRPADGERRAGRRPARPGPGADHGPARAA